jgi:hypothetical protein
MAFIKRDLSVQFSTKFFKGISHEMIIDRDITFLIFFFSECFIEAKGMVKFSKSVISRSNSYILGLMKIACNISAKSELGRFPITDYIKTQAILYFCRLQTDPINPLLISLL